MRRTSTRAVVASALLLGFSLNALTDEVPAYEARPVAVPIDATYVSTDHFVGIAGSDGSEEMLTEFNELFAKTHSGFKFRLLVGGLPSISLYGLITGVSAFALIDREIWPLETRPFRQIHGYEPTAIRIGLVGYSGPGRMSPPGVYVNARNPLAGLTVEQVARVFTTGGGNGDMTHWGQLGLTGAWTQRVIHLYGPRDDGRLASALRHFKMKGFPFARRYERLSTSAEIIHAVAMDPYGIALAGFCDAKLLSPAVKMLPLVEQEGAPFAGSSYEEVLAGKYPFSPHLYLYFNRVPGKPLDPFVKEYARLLLSREGQAIVAAQKDTPKGYLPLNAKEVAEELTKLER
jgi:phosphate transport system substrate-binding protein